MLAVIGRNRHCSLLPFGCAALLEAVANNAVIAMWFSFLKRASSQGASSKCRSSQPGWMFPDGFPKSV